MLDENGACHMMVSLVLQLCMFLGIAMGKILCYDNCMMKNILKNKKFWKIICILAIIAYTAKNLFIGADTDEGYGIMAGYRLAMGDRLLLEMWEPDFCHFYGGFYQAVCEADRWSELSEPVFAAHIFPNPGVRQRLSV